MRRLAPLLLLAGCTSAPAAPHTNSLPADPTWTGELREAWSYEAPANRLLHFPGVADPDGNLYWFECNDCSCGAAPWCDRAALRVTMDANVGLSLPTEQAVVCEVVSASPDGTIRWRQPTELAVAPISAAIGDGLLVLAGQVTLVAHRLDTGVLAWQTQLTGGSTGRMAPLVSVGNGRAIYRTTSAQEARLGAVSLADGSALGSRSAAAYDEAVVDETGRLIVEETFPGENTIIARDGGGEWTTESPTGKPSDLGGPVATWNGTTLLLRPTAILRNADGALLHQLPELWRDETSFLGGTRWPLEQPRPIVLTDGFALVGSGGPSRTEPGPWELRLSRLDLGSGAIAWTTALLDGTGDASLSSPWLTDAGTLAIAAGNGTGGTWTAELLEIDANGAILHRAPFPSTDRPLGPAVLLRDRWIGATATTAPAGAACEGEVLRPIIRAWDVPGLAPASEGWVTDGGDSTRANRPRVAR